MPNNSSWVPSLVLWSVAVLWSLGALIYLLKHRKEWSESKRQLRNEWIQLKLPYLAKLTETLANLHRRTTEISKALESRDVKPEVVIRCNKEYEDMLRLGFVKGLVDYSRVRTVQQVDQVVLQVCKKVKNLFDRRLLTHAKELASIMENHRIGLQPYLDKDEEYKKLNADLSVERSRVDKATADLIEKYVGWSYSLNSVVMLYTYMQNAIKDAPQKPLIMSQPVSSFRKGLDDFMFHLLAGIQESIENTVRQ